VLKGITTQPEIVTGHQKHRDPRFPPYAFTEHGAIMAATIRELMSPPEPKRRTIRFTADLGEKS
jgi:hypothetical protein